MSAISDRKFVSFSSTFETSASDAMMRMAPVKSEPEENMFPAIRARATLADIATTFSSNIATSSTIQPGLNHTKFNYIEENLFLSRKNNSSDSITTKKNKRIAHDKEESWSDEKDNKHEPKRKRQKNGKKPKDMPRRALNAYNIFFSEQRKLILEEIERKEQEQSLQQKDGYDTFGFNSLFSKLEKDYRGSDSLILSPVKIQAKSLEPDAIPCVLKQRRSNMTRTRRRHRKVHGKISFVELARKVSTRWKELSDEDRKYYEALAAEDKIRQIKAMKNYKELKTPDCTLAPEENFTLTEKPQEQHEPETFSLGDMGNHLNVANNSHLYSSHETRIQQQRQQHHELQGEHQLDPMRQVPTSSLCIEPLPLDYEYQGVDGFDMPPANNIGDIDLVGSNFAPANAFAALPSPPPQQPREPAIRIQQSSVAPLTNLERRMMIKCLARAEATSINTGAQFEPTPCFSEELSTPCCFNQMTLPTLHSHEIGFL